MDMMNMRLLLVCLVLATSLLPHITPTHANENPNPSNRHTYIVRVRPPSDFTIGMRRRSKQQLESWYRSFLPPKMAASKSPSPFVYTYSEAMLGFAVNLTKEEAEMVRRRDGVLKLYQDSLVPLLTTHTPDFLGLRGEGGAWSSAGMGEGVVVGVLDTGVEFTHVSFDDGGMGSPPERWRGSCEPSPSSGVRCNKKLVGARTFINGQGAYRVPPVDDAGHGTHTASTAAGGFVEGASVLGSGNGTASGMAPRAHLAIYKVCSPMGCFSSDILAGMEAAIDDGVDVMSMSLGGTPAPFHSDVMAIGAFSAMRRGILVSCAAGNSGPFAGTLTNEAPWMLTVGASTMDREMNAVVHLDDGRSFAGESAYQPPASLPPLLLAYPGDYSEFTDMIVLLGRSTPGIERLMKDSNASGIILLGDEDTGNTKLADAHVLPASYVNFQDAQEITRYVDTHNGTKASITFNGTSLGTSPAPVVAFFSSRGPSSVSPGILKPDIIGPGVNVIAAWPFKVGPEQTPSNGDGDGKNFNSISGTSMATPHLSGVAAIVKSSHPDWSPAAIKSAMMTTAYVVNNRKDPIQDQKLKRANHFAVGAGHVSPSKATDPGLIYDIDEEQYVAYLCGLGYTDDEVETIAHRKDACKTGGKKKIAEAELNYPSVAVRASEGRLVVNRTVTNVGNATSSYTVVLDMPKDVSVVVSPAKLEFMKVNEKKDFVLNLSWDSKKTEQAEGSFSWVSDKHLVRSPVVIF